MEHDIDVRELSRRVVRLERRSRRLGALCAVLVAFLGAGILTGAHRAPDEVRARRFVLLDDKGAVAASLGIDDRHPTLSMRSKGAEVVRITADSAPHITLRGHSSGFEVRAPDDTLRATFGVTTMRRAHLHLMDEKGVARASLKADVHHAAIGINDPTDKAGVRMLCLKNGDAQLGVFDRTNQKRAVLGVTGKRPPSSLTPYDARGRRVFAAPDR